MLGVITIKDWSLSVRSCDLFEADLTCMYKVLSAPAQVWPLDSWHHQGFAHHIARTACILLCPQMSRCQMLKSHFPTLLPSETKNILNHILQFFYAITFDICLLVLNSHILIFFHKEISVQDYHARLYLTFMPINIYQSGLIRSFGQSIEPFCNYYPGKRYSSLNTHWHWPWHPMR